MSVPFCGCWSLGAVSGPASPGAPWSSPPPPRYTCKCAEHLYVNEWEWEPATQETTSYEALLSECRREITFHRIHSSGTAIVRGTVPFKNDHLYYWEIKILTTLYGTDVMIGVGAPNIDFLKYKYQFTSFLGLDSDSYGLSYTGRIQHGGVYQKYCNGFGKGVIVGVFLDMWHGTLEFYMNRKPMGVAYRGLKRHTVLYPMVSSTASQSAVRLIYSMCCPVSLSFHSAKVLSQHRPSFEKAQKIPGLKLYFENAFWILLPTLKKFDKNNSNDIDNVLYNGVTKEEKQSSSYFPNNCSNRRRHHFAIDVDFSSVHADIQNALSNDTSNDKTVINTGQNSVSEVQSLSGVNRSTAENNDDLWLTALESTSKLNSNGDLNTVSEGIWEDGLISFTNRNDSTKCQSCSLRMARVTIERTQMKLCLDCYYSFVKQTNDMNNGM